jgi:hypothetical protein
MSRETRGNPVQPLRGVRFGTAALMQSTAASAVWRWLVDRPETTNRSTTGSEPAADRPCDPRPSPHRVLFYSICQSTKNKASLACAPALLQLHMNMRRGFKKSAEFVEICRNLMDLVMTEFLNIGTAHTKIGTVYPKFGEKIRMD